MSKRLLDYDPLTGTKTFFEYDHSTQRTTIETEQDATYAFDRSKMLADTLNKKEDWWSIGHVDDVMIMQWAKECGCKPYSKEWHAYAMKQLNKSEYRKFNPNKVRV